MDNSITKLHVVDPIIEKDPSGLSPETKRLVTLGHRHYWPFQILGRAPMLQESVRMGDWLLVSAQDDSTKIPEHALTRIQAIFAAGIRPQGFVLVHEAPKFLKAPVETKAKPLLQSSMLSASGALSQSKTDFVSMIGIGLSTLASLFFPLLFMFFTTALVDPILVAVTGDGYWVEIDRWYTE